jgi:hypothetical protein
MMLPLIYFTRFEPFRRLNSVENFHFEKIGSALSSKTDSKPLWGFSSQTNWREQNPGVSKDRSFVNFSRSVPN